MDYSFVAAILAVPNVSHLITESLEPLMLSCRSRKGLVADLSSLVLGIVTACNLTYERESENTLYPSSRKLQLLSSATRSRTRQW
jgi:hypothetical protein